MKYLVNARFLTQRVTGVQRYALSCSLALQDLLGDDVTFVAPKGDLAPEARELRQIVQHGCFGGHLWEQILLPLYARSMGRPILFCFCGLPPLSYRRVVYCIHDLAVFRFPQGFSKIFGSVYRAATKIAVRTVTRIICVSEFTKSEISSMLNYNDAFVVNNAVPVVRAEYVDEADSQGLGIASPYILAVGSIEPRKNLDNLIKAFNRLHRQELRLVIVGDKGAAFRQYQDLAFDRRDVIFTGYLPDDLLARLYNDALCFVYPSLYEGFGIPPLEAMQNYCPVLASNCSSIPEVCGDAAFYFNPNSSDSIYEAINIFLSLSPTDQRMREQAGQSRVQLFSFENQKSQLQQLIATL